MPGYKTVEEIAAELDVTPRYVQHLCRNGRIEGVIKRAGIWLIPADAAIPLRRSSFGEGEGKFVFAGTKKAIFDSSIELFTAKGYENVSIRSIANAVGTRQSAVYNHFASKQEILNAIYDFYCNFNIVDRPTLSEIEPILQNGSLMDIMQSVIYSFELQEMADIIKIIIQRRVIDERADEMCRAMLKEGIRFVEEVFNRAVEIGRLAAFDTHTMAVFINGIRWGILQLWLTDSSPDVMEKAAEDEKSIYGYAASLLTDLKPPAEIDPESHE